jgi:hypothetical protein
MKTTLALLLTVLITPAAQAEIFPLDTLDIWGPADVPERYEYELTSTGIPTLHIRSKGNVPIEGDFLGGFLWRQDPTPYIGSTVLLSVDVEADAIYGSDSGAHLFLKQRRLTRPEDGIDAKTCMLFFDNSDNRPFQTLNQKGTMTVVSHIQPGAEILDIGFWLERA